MSDEQNGFFGLFKDDNSIVVDNSENNDVSPAQQNNDLANKCVKNLLNFVKSDEKFEYKYKFTIDKVKYKK